MDLDDLRARRSHVIAAQSMLEWTERAEPGDVEVRVSPTWDVPEVEYTVTRQEDGAWSAAQWYWEAGGGRTIASIRTATLEIGLDWVWWTSATDFLTAYVRPAAEQKDVQRRETARWMLTIPHRGPTSALGESARVPWEDASDDGAALRRAARSARGLAAFRLARNPRTPGDALDRLASGDLAARWQVAGNPAALPATLDRLRASGDRVVRWYLARRPETPTEDVVAWAVEDPALWTAVLDRSDVSAAQLADLDDASSGALRPRIARHPGADAALVGRLARECDPATAAALLADGRVTGADIDAIAAGIDAAAAAAERTWPLSVSGALEPLRHPMERTIVLEVGESPAERLAQGGRAAVRTIAAVARGTTRASVARLAEDESEDVRRLVATRPDLEIATQRSLLGDAAESVRRYLAQNHRIAPETAAALVRDGERWVRLDAIRNPRLPLPVLETLLDGPDAESARSLHRIRTAPPDSIPTPGPVEDERPGRGGSRHWWAGFRTGRRRRGPRER